MEGLGFIMHWGFTPGVNVFANCDNIDVNSDKEINILMSETGGDIRHVLKSVTDILPLKKIIHSESERNKCNDHC